MKVLLPNLFPSVQKYLIRSFVTQVLKKYPKLSKFLKNHFGLGKIYVSLSSSFHLSSEKYYQKSQYLQNFPEMFLNLQISLETMFLTF